MSKTLEDVRGTLSGQPRRRWTPWRRRPLADQVSDVSSQVSATASTIAEQVGQKTSEIAGQVGQKTSDLAGRMRLGKRSATAQIGTAASDVGELVGQGTASLLGRAGETTLGLLDQAPAAVQAGRRRIPWRRAPQGEQAAAPGTLGRRYWPLGSPADLAAERAALAAESASVAAERAEGLMERLSGLLRWQANQAATSSAPQAAEPAPVLLVPQADKQKRSVTDTLKRAATSMGERVNELSDGRYGLEPVRTKAQKKAAKSLAAQEREVAKLAEKSSRSSGLAWTIGLALGLVVGLVGVAYWQRRRLQQMWGETSQRMQQATDELRQRFETQRGASIQPGRLGAAPLAERPGLAETTPGASTFTPLGSVPPITDLGQQTNGRVESGTQ